LAEVRRRGIEVRVFSLSTPRAGLRHDIVARAGLDQITSYPPKDFLVELKEFRPQLLHAHFATEATAAAIALAAELDLPLTFTAHGYDIHRKAPVDFAARAGAAAAVVTVSQANADFMSQTLGVPTSHIRVIPCGIDTDRFRPAAPGNSTLEPPLIVCVARHVPVKNLGLLLEGCATLKRRGLNFRCVIVGDGPARPDLEATRLRLGLLDVVDLPGAAEQAEVLKWWQKASVGVLTSENEGMPVSLMEAAACGVPVVATAVGGITELVQNGVTGLLVPAGDAAALAEALEQVVTTPDLKNRLGLAARHRAEQMFSVKIQVDRLVGLWSEILTGGARSRIYVSDPFEAANDPELPTLTKALNPLEAKEQFKRRLPRLAGAGATIRLKAIRVTRHKPGRRCIVEYDIRLQQPNGPEQSVTLIGKARARRFGKAGYRLLDQIWNAGFDSVSPDGVSVPEPLGVIPQFQMWFQRKVPGETATLLLGRPNGAGLARRIAEAIHKLHKANVPTERRHGMADELRILHECLAKVTEMKPAWKNRLENVLAACERLGATVPEPGVCGIHRDFYPAQVVVDQERVYLIDFDLYCLGDPGLDIGNFIGHMTEQSLRELGDPQAWVKQEQALEERFIELSGECCRPSVQAYTILTLVRHIYLSTQFARRQEFTEPLIALCEERLRLRSQVPR